ncbi:MAG: nitronate monooxygenase [Alphaproteobacteria bacterium]|nr:nitronate monooxygenase [Alphaproteobacteria bacterium]
MINLEPIMISGKEVFPLIEGGKGINASDGRSAGAWAHENCVGTFSGVSPDFYDAKGNVIVERFMKRIRPERHEEMIDYAIRGGVAQAQVAHEVSGGNGRVHMNMLWEMADSERIIEGVLEKAKGLINGLTCGAGLPYHLGELASKFGVYYYPIVSSARAFQVLWKRAYSNFQEFLGGVVYEDPWLAGGHNGLSNAEDPNQPQSPYMRLVELRKALRALNLDNIPIIIAGGVWRLDEWKDYINNPDIGKVAFQFGTRPMITKESPISDAWKKLMLQVKKGDVILQRFSPTGFFSSAIKNTFLEKLMNRKDGEIAFKTEADSEYTQPLKISETKTVYIKAEDMEKANRQLNAGLSVIQETPDNTVVFMTPEDWKQMKQDRAECVGCLSQCQFSTWSRAKGTTGKLPDPRSYCIHKTLYDVGHNGSIMDNLVFAGHQVYRFATDPLYRDGIPSVKELIEMIKQGK